MTHPIKTREEIAARLKQAREKAGYTSVESFCEKNKLPLNRYQDQEEGRVAIPLSQAAHYSRLLKVSLRWLLLGKIE